MLSVCRWWGGFVVQAVNKLLLHQNIPYALRFYRLHAEMIPHKPIGTGHYIIKNSYLATDFSDNFKLAVILETVRDRAKRSKFSTSKDLLPMKLHL